MRTIIDQRKTARQRGYDKAWQKVRHAHLAMYPLCIVCGSRAVDVDHIETIRLNPKRRLDPTNLQSLCASHHKIVTNAHDMGAHGGGGDGVASGQVDASGAHLDPAHPWYQGPPMAPGEARAGMKAANLASNRRMKGRSP